MALAAVFAAMCLLVSCSGVPAYANVDPTWEEEETVIPEQTPEEAEPEETVAEETEPAEPEQGFSTPGNGDLGDEITNSSGKDFYTIHTKNNNTFYLVVDHSNNTENVYMLSLIDENDLAEFMEQTEKETEPEVTPAVVIPETPPTEAPQQPEETEPETEPEKQNLVQSNTMLILGAALLAVVLIYYFKVYKPKHEEEDDENEGIEMGDGLPTEHEE